MVLTDLVRVPLDFLLIILVNGTPSGQCVPVVIAQDTSLEVRQAELRCRTSDGMVFDIEPEDLQTSPELFGAQAQSDITIQLSALEMF
ncbi:MAG: hypothetical protein AAFV90_16765 [Cyanobacteria bacterium J06634_5]